MKVIIDPYRGGSDTGEQINNQYEKNILLNISKYMAEKLNELGISTELVRNNDISLTDEERNSIINEIKDKNLLKKYSVAKVMELSALAGGREKALKDAPFYIETALRGIFDGKAEAVFR